MTSPLPQQSKRISMFGLRWINATSYAWHARADCPVLRTSRKRFGWTPFPITLGYGADFYKPCGVCTHATTPKETR